MPTDKELIEGFKADFFLKNSSDEEISEPINEDQGTVFGTITYDPESKELITKILHEDE